MLCSILYLGYVYLLRTPLTLALTLPSIQALSSPPTSISTTSSTSPGPASLTLDFPSLPQNLSREPGPPTCDGSVFGFDMTRDSCLQAWVSIPFNNRLRTFGERGKGQFGVWLPRRFSSRKWVLLFYETSNFFRGHFELSFID